MKTNVKVAGHDNILSFPPEATREQIHKYLNKRFKKIKEEIKEEPEKVIEPEPEPEENQLEKRIDSIEKTFAENMAKILASISELKEKEVKSELPQIKKTIAVLGQNLLTTINESVDDIKSHVLVHKNKPNLNVIEKPMADYSDDIQMLKTKEKEIEEKLKKILKKYKTISEKSGRSTFTVINDSLFTKTPVTSDITVTVTSGKLLLECNATSGDINIALPSYVGNTALIVIQKIDSSSNTVTITGFGTQTINGSATKIIQNQNTSIPIMAGINEWRIF